MSTAWPGADPSQSTDNRAYSLGVTVRANDTITVTAIRVWAGPGAVVRANRRGRIWDTAAGSQLALATMPDSLPSGWSEYQLTTALDLDPGDVVTVAYDTGGLYGELLHAFDAEVQSADAAVTFLSAAEAAHGNGSFTTTVGSQPTTANGTHSFYGIDLVYTVDSGGDEPPTVSGLGVDEDGLTVTAQCHATDPQGQTLTYVFDWGDGTQTAGSAATAQHSYEVGGVYAILCTVTNTAGLTASIAKPADLVAPDPGVHDLDYVALTAALVSHAMQLGVFDAVQGHPALSPPGNGVTGAVWLFTDRPARGQSGLAATSVVATFLFRIYKPLVSPNQDWIETDMLAAWVQLRKAYSTNFTLGGLIRNIDLLGALGVPLGVQSGFQKVGDVDFRVLDVTVPCVINDVAAQIP